jgi:hypothetical protein
MKEIMRRWLWRARSGWQAWPGQQRGQSLIIIIFALIGILAFVGLGVDLGLVYVERVRVGRAADAAALAAASELPLEAAAHARALAYLQENGYDSDDVANVRVVINPGAADQQISGASEAAALTTIWLDTAFARQTPQHGEDTTNTSDRIRVRVRRQVPMTFLQFVGFRRFPVEATAEAENINNLDVVIVYDRSGSMEFDTLCYECWIPQKSATPDLCTNPDGCIFPLPWSTVSPTATAAHCANSATYVSYNSSFNVNDYNYRHKTDTGRYYIVIEAEEYSYLRVEADYHGWGYTPYKTFWVIQRNDGTGSTGRDTRGGYITHNPFTNHENSQGGLGVACTWADLNNPDIAKCGDGVPGGDDSCCARNWTDGSPVAGGPYAAPRADYDFNAPTATTYYFWVRGQGGNNWGVSPSNNYIFWGTDQTIRGQESSFPEGPSYDGASSGAWNWRCLGSVSLSQGTHTLNLWGGGAGFDVDRMVITTNSANCSDDSDPPDSSGGLTANNARTRWACNSCDPRFAGRPGGFKPAGSSWWLPDCSVGANPDQSRDPIYGGEQPIRDALSAARNFIARMDFGLDQIGYARYESSSGVANQLECLRRRGPANLESPSCDASWYTDYPNPYAGGTYPADTDCGCFPLVITNTVLYQLNATTAGGGTNMAGGIEDGIQVLNTSGPCSTSNPVNCGRPGAAHIMVLMTDGEANVHDGNTCHAQDLWPNNTGNSSIDQAKDCVIYYALQARDNGIVVYTISLGYSADLELMQEVADLTGGVHRWAPSPDKLNAIFEELFERIFLRLIE